MARFLRKTPLYDNARLLAPDGEILCTCDNKKASWYVSKGLGSFESSSQDEQNVLIVRLNFEPKGRPKDEHGAYYTKDKDNKCVVCGLTNSVLRKYIVPRDYRKHFPKIMRDHQSHDVLLLCFPCHQSWSLKDQELRSVLSKRCNAPLIPVNKPQNLCDMEIKSVVSAGKALMKNKGQIPVDRVKILESVLLDYFDVEELTDTWIENASNLKATPTHVNDYSHGKFVVDYFLRSKEGIQTLEVLWRKHFLSSMNPACLPELWSVDHQLDKLALDPQGRAQVDASKLYESFMDLKKDFIIP